jgi:hypothetical protein
MSTTQENRQEKTIKISEQSLLQLKEAKRTIYPDGVGRRVPYSDAIKELSCRAIEKESPDGERDLPEMRGGA